MNRVLDWLTFGPYRREVAEVKQLRVELNRGLQIVGWGRERRLVIPGEAQRLRSRLAKRKANRQLYEQFEARQPKLSYDQLVAELHKLRKGYEQASTGPRADDPYWIGLEHAYEQAARDLAELLGKVQSK